MKATHVVRSLGTVLAAGAVGAGVALLWAPYAGFKTRRIIRRKAEDTMDGVRDVFGVIREAGGDARRQAYRLRLRLPSLDTIKRTAT
jgi:gas vesicle protein